MLFQLAKKLNDLCETYVDHLQSEECEIKQKEMREMREKIQQLQVKLDEGKLKDDLINTLQAAALESDNKIKDLQEELARERTKIHEHPDEDQFSKNNTNFLDNQHETISKLREQISFRDTTLTHLQSIATQYETQFNDQEKTLEAKAETIHRLQEVIENQNSTLMEYEKNLIKLRRPKCGVYKVVILTAFTM